MASPTILGPLPPTNTYSNPRRIASSARPRTRPAPPGCLHRLSFLEKRLPAWRHEAS
jgi:hypothetical protein